MTGRLGVIDIGSNSIRLVVYDALKRSAAAAVQRKSILRAGKRACLPAASSILKALKLAETSIARFLALVRILDVVELQILATAAVRDALRRGGVRGKAGA